MSSRHGARAPRRRLPLVPLVVGAAVLLGLIAIIVSSGGSDDDAAPEGIEQTQPVEVVGDALPPFAGGEDAAVGRPAPTLEGRTFDGTPVVLGDEGPAVLVFVAHWCPHCQREVPLIADWLDDEGPPDGVDLAFVATGTTSSRPNYPPSSWLEEEGIDLPVLADDEAGTAGAAYGLTGYPLFVAIAGDGSVAARASGEIGIDGLEALIEEARASGASS